MADLAIFIVAVLLQLVQFTFAGDYCGGSWSIGKYCTHGCCGWNDSDCCSSAIGSIIGAVVGVGVFIFVIIFVCCVCNRRRRLQGAVMSPGANAVVIQQGTVMHQGVVATSGVQPGLTYPPPNYGGYAYPTGPQPYPTQQQYQGQPQQYQGQPQQYQGQPQPHQGQPYPQGPPPAFAAPPPAYQDVTGTAPPYGGNTNAAFDGKH